ncbi:phage tail protein [Oceanimonas smirnovii]|uniref:phage tail protein n=1 Tax=Oceanimonas smirnovii TaxID=264574 RepID=UPI003FD4B353
MELFSWCPDTCELAETPRHKEVKFGNGYSQRKRDGINNLLATYTLTFSDKPATIGALREFLQRHGGVDAFQFQLPGELPVKVVCKQWGGPRRGGWWQLNCVFEEVPA